MFYLFNTDQINLPDFFRSISEEEIEECCTSKVFHRGNDYFTSGSVEEAAFNADKLKLKTMVVGDSDYTVQISLQKGEVAGSCTCPYETVCKHIIASLLFAVDEKSEIDVDTNSKKLEPDINQYLQSLSKKELIDLVKKFAPDQFRVEVKNNSSDLSTAQNIFKKTERNIQKIFNDSNDLYNPVDFEEVLDKEIKKLTGLEKHLKNEIKSLLFLIIKEVDNAIGEGYLYDHYNDENYEPSGEFNEFVSSFVNNLSYEEKLLFFTELEKTLREQSYNTFDSLSQLSEISFTEDDLPSLKDMLINSFRELSPHLIENYYNRVRQLLSKQERILILSEIQNNSSKNIIELAGLYDSTNQELKAIDSLEVWLSGHNAYDIDKVYILWLDLPGKAGLSISEAAKKAIIAN